MTTAPPFVPFRQHLEQQGHAFFGEGDISQFVQDEHPIRGIAVDDATQGDPLARLQEFVGQTAASDKAGSPAAETHKDGWRPAAISNMELRKEHKKLHRGLAA